MAKNSNFQLKTGYVKNKYDLFHNLKGIDFLKKMFSKRKGDLWSIFTSISSLLSAPVLNIISTDASISPISCPTFPYFNCFLVLTFELTSPIFSRFSIFIPPGYIKKPPVLFSGGTEVGLWLKMGVNLVTVLMLLINFVRSSLIGSISKS